MPCSTMPEAHRPPHSATAPQPLVEPAAGRTAWWLPSLVTTALVLGFYAWKWRTLSAFVTSIDNHEQFMQDFVAHYYPMGQRVFVNPTPVPGYLYTSFFAVLMAPIAHLDLPAAMFVWGALQAIGVVALGLTAGRGLLQLGPRATAAMLFLVMTSLPVLDNVKWGQVSVLVTACVFGACALQHRGRSVLAGTLLAFATAIKLYPAAFVGYLLLRRDWRAVVAFVVGSVLFYCVVPAVALGFDAWFAFERTVAATAGSIDVAANIGSQFLPNVVLRWGFLHWGQVPAPAWLTTIRIGGYVLAAVCAGLAAVSLRQRGARATIPIVCLLLAMPLVVQTSWTHYFVFLPFCQVALLVRLVSIARAANGSRRRRLAFGCAALPAASMVLGSVFGFDACGGWVHYNGYGVPLVADLLLVAATIVLLRLGRDGADRSGPDRQA